MNRICVAIMCACTLLLGGCLHASKSVFPQHYTLTGAGLTGAGLTEAGLTATGAEGVARRHRTTGRQRYILQIDRIEVPQWLQGTDMYYQLGYQHSARISAYARSDWVAPPATLLERIVQETIREGGGWQAVVGPGDSAQATVDLHMRLDHFSQYFAKKSMSYGVIEASATLLDNRDDSVIAQKHFRIKAAAPSADAAGGVKALNQASRTFATRLRRWLQAAPVDRAVHSSKPEAH